MFKIFGGILRSHITCDKCNSTSETIDETFTLNLPLPDGSCTFEDALSELFSIDKLTNHNKYMCSKCRSMQNATKQLTVKHAPRILIAAIKRFDSRGRKVQRRLKYPPNFNLKPYTSKAIDKDIPVGEIPDELYDLYGVVIHQGASTDGGHYYAYCKANTGEW